MSRGINEKSIILNPKNMSNIEKQILENQMLILEILRVNLKEYQTGLLKDINQNIQKTNILLKNQS